MADLTVSSDIDTFMASANFAAARTNLGLELGSDIQAYDAQLEDIAGLATTDGGFIVGNGSTFVLESGATARTSLGLGSIAVLSAPSGTVVGTSDTQTLTNKTIDGDSNTLSNLDIGNEVDWAAAADVADRSAAPASGDKLLLFEAGVGLRKIDWDDLPSGGGGGSFSLPYSDGDTVTGSDATTTFELTPTWNTTGAPTVYGCNVTNTASAATSKLLDLQADSSNIFSVEANSPKINIGDSSYLENYAQTGQPENASLAITATQYVSARANNFAVISGSVRKGLWTPGFGIRVLSSDVIGWSSSATDAGFAPDTRLYRDAANTLAQRNGTSSQTFNIYNTYTSGTNYERGFAKWDSNVFIIGNEAGSGGGSGRVLEIRSAAQIDLTCFGSIKPVRISSSGIALYNGYDLVSITPGGSDVGKTSGRFGSAYLGSSLTGSDATPNIDIETAWNTTGAPSLIKANVTDTASDGASLLMDLQVGGSSKFRVTKGGLIEQRGTSVGDILVRTGFDNYGLSYNNNGELFANLSGNGRTVIGFNVTTTGALRFAASASSSGNLSADVYVVRDGAANTLGLRNGTSAQTLNIYNTYTSSTNYERLAITWDTNQCILRTEAGSGGGTKRGVTINSSVSSADTVTIGNLAGLNMTGIRNVAVGDEALEAMTSGYDNVAVGHQALHLLSFNANRCVAIGKAAGIQMTAGFNATLIGANAGNTYANMTDCTIIGSGADTSASGETGSIAIGSGIISSGTDGLNIGNVIQGTMTSSSEVIRFRGASSAAADPTTAELPTARDWGIHKNTSSGNVYLAYNDGGSIVKVQLT